MKKTLNLWISFAKLYVPTGEHREIIVELICYILGKKFSKLCLLFYMCHLQP
jgi:hypothetical protein